jgi:hypothetical protein
LWNHLAISGVPLQLEATIQTPLGEIFASTLYNNVTFDIREIESRTDSIASIEDSQLTKDQPLGITDDRSRRVSEVRSERPFDYVWSTAT